MRNNIEFVETDFREYVLIEGKLYQIGIYQIELLRILNMCNNVNSNLIADKIKRAIYIKDYLLNQRTDFNRQLPRGNIESQFLSPREKLEINMNRKKIDENMKIFYKN